MVKKSLTGCKMSDAAFVDEAAAWSRDLARMKSRGPGDLEQAMRSIEREYGIDYWAQWTLRYRPSRVKDIGHALYLRLKAAWETERQRQIRRLQHDTAITEALLGADQSDVAAAKAALGTHLVEGK